MLSRCLPKREHANMHKRGKTICTRIYASYPTTNGGMRNGRSVGYTLHAHFCTLGADWYAQSALSNKICASELSLLRVRSWLGTYLCGWVGESIGIYVQYISECPLCLLRSSRPDGWSNPCQNLHVVLFFSRGSHRWVKFFL